MVQLLFLLLLLRIWATLYSTWESVCSYILVVKQVLAIAVCTSLWLYSLHLCWIFCWKSVQLNMSCYQVCCAAAVERFLSSESIPADCLCLVCCHAACLIYALIWELLLWFPLDPVCQSHASCSVSAPINQVNISVLQLLQHWFRSWVQLRVKCLWTSMFLWSWVLSINKKFYGLPFSFKKGNNKVEICLWAYILQ